MLRIGISFDKPGSQMQGTRGNCRIRKTLFWAVGSLKQSFFHGEGTVKGKGKELVMTLREVSDIILYTRRN